MRSNPNQDLSGLSRDPAGALNALGKIFDKKKVQEKQGLANLFGQEVFKAIGDLKLKEGSPEKAALDAFAGGLMAKLGGGSVASGAAGAGFNQLLMTELSNIKDPAVMQWASAIVGVATAKIVGGDAQTGASVAASETKNNKLSHEQQQQKLKELENAKNDEERIAIKAKWDNISDAQEGDPNIEVSGAIVYDKEDNPNLLVIAKKPEYSFDWQFLLDYPAGLKENVYGFYKQEIAPIGQGLGASIAQNTTFNILQPDMSINNANPQMYYFGKMLGDTAFVIGGTFTTIGGAGATIVTSPTGVGAVVGGAATVAAAGATVNAANNLSQDANKMLVSSGTNTEGSSKADRVYVPNPKHDAPGGNISPNPFGNNAAAGQKSLETAYSSSGTKQLYNVHEGKLVKFQPDNAGGYHPYEVINPAKEVPTDVLRQMKNDGSISNAQYNKWIKNQ